MSPKRGFTKAREASRKFCNRRCYGDWMKAKSQGFENLSPRQLQVFVLFLEGRRWKEIAASLEINQRTISTYKLDLCQKLGAANEVELVKAGIRYGLTAL